MHFSKILCTLILVMIFVSDAQAQSKKLKPISILSSPSEANVKIWDVKKEKLIFECVTPCDANVILKKHYHVSFDKDGHISKTYSLYIAKKDYFEGIQFKASLGKRIQTTNFSGIEKSDICAGKAVLSTLSNQDPIYCVRIPPIVPPSANQSGYCNITYDVSKSGRPENVLATECTDDIFRASAINAVKRFKLAPAIKNGQPITFKGLESYIRFILVDRKGKIIPIVFHPELPVKKE